MEKKDIIRKLDELGALLVEITNEPDILEVLSCEGVEHLTELMDEVACLINTDLQQHENF